MSELPEKSEKPLLQNLREVAFYFYTIWFRQQFVRWMVGDLDIGDRKLRITRLREATCPDLNDFFCREFDQEDLVFAGVESKKLSFKHSCFIYFGVYEDDILVALWWFNVLGRKLVEPSLVIAKSWRKRGMLSSWYKIVQTISEKHKICLTYKINVENQLMLAYLKKQGLKPEFKEGHLYIFNVNY